jgi:hypothetical protein
VAWGEARDTSERRKTNDIEMTLSIWRQLRERYRLSIAWRQRSLTRQKNIFLILERIVHASC